MMLVLLADSALDVRDISAQLSVLSEIDMVDGNVAYSSAGRVGDCRLNHYNYCVCG